MKVSVINLFTPFLGSSGICYDEATGEKELCLNSVQDKTVPKNNQGDFCITLTLNPQICARIPQQDRWFPVLRRITSREVATPRGTKVAPMHLWHFTQVPEMPLSVGTRLQESGALAREIQ